MAAYRADDVGVRLLAFLEAWSRRRSGWVYVPSAWPPRLRSATEVAQGLLTDAAFAEVGLGTALQGPDGKLIEAVVGALLPQPYGLEFQLLVDALILAGNAQRQRKVAAAAAYVTGAGLLIAGMAVAWRLGVGPKSG